MGHLEVYDCLGLRNYFFKQFSKLRYFPLSVTELEQGRAYSVVPIYLERFKEGGVATDDGQALV